MPAAAESLPRATRSAPKAWALLARARTFLLSPRCMRTLPLGGCLVVGMSKTSCASRCSRRSVQGALRAPAEGEGRLARREDLTAAAAATLERGGSRGGAGTVAHGTRAARERRRRRAKVSRRRRALGGARACRAFERLGGPWSAPPLNGRRADDFFLGLGFPPVNWGSITRVFGRTTWYRLLLLPSTCWRPVTWWKGVRFGLGSGLRVRISVRNIVHALGGFLDLLRRRF